MCDFLWDWKKYTCDRFYEVGDTRSMVFMCRNTVMTICERFFVGLGHRCGVKKLFNPNVLSPMLIVLFPFVNTDEVDF